MNNNRIVVQSTHEKTHVENCFLLAKYACPPLVSKKLQAPPGDSFAYYYRPPLAEGQGGVWDLQANAAPTWGRRPRPPMRAYVPNNLHTYFLKCCECVRTLVSTLVCKYVSTDFLSVF